VWGGGRPWALGKNFFLKGEKTWKEKGSETNYITREECVCFGGFFREKEVWRGAIVIVHRGDRTKKEQGLNAFIMGKGKGRNRGIRGEQECLEPGESR